ncbi:MAG: hypothetical protein KDA53_15290 [Hyphomonas sp.]|nr:hypothetical protein [Hyphomonas sp.]
MSIATLKARGLLRTVQAAPSQPIAFPFGLGERGVHEVAEAAYGDRAAATGFVLTAAQRGRKGVWLWVCQAGIARDLGHVPEAALREMSGGHRPRLSIHTRHGADALWAVEEAVVSGAVAHVVAEVEAADFTATRRLTLASEKHGVPVTLLLPYACDGATAAATRWRLAPRPSAPNPHDPHAPGYPRFRAVLERCRAAPDLAGRTYDLEWNDETLSLGLVSGMAAGPAAPRPAAGGGIVHRKAG